MSKTVKSTVTTDEQTVETSEKKHNFTVKHAAIAAASLTAVVAVVALVLKAKNGDFEDVSVGDLAVVETPSTN